MTQKEIDIIVNDPDIWDLLHYVYCLIHAPDQFSDVRSCQSEIRQTSRMIVDQIQRKKIKFD